MCCSQPLVDGRDEDGRLVADRELVVPRGHGAVPFEEINTAFDSMSSLVVLRVERRRATAADPEFIAIASLVGLIGDGAAAARLRRYARFFREAYA